MRLHAVLLALALAHASHVQPVKRPQPPTRTPPHVNKPDTPTRQPHIIISNPKPPSTNTENQQKEREYNPQHEPEFVKQAHAHDSHPIPVSFEHPVLLKDPRPHKVKSLASSRLQDMSAVQIAVTARRQLTEEGDKAPVPQVGKGLAWKPHSGSNTHSVAPPHKPQATVIHKRDLHIHV